MPTQKEMAEAYIVQVENKIAELTTQVEQLKNHVAECRSTLKEEDSNDDDGKGNDD